jgi:hypothetical protein
MGLTADISWCRPHTGCSGPKLPQPRSLGPILLQAGVGKGHHGPSVSQQRTIILALATLKVYMYRKTTPLVNGEARTGAATGETRASKCQTWDRLRVLRQMAADVDFCECEAISHKMTTFAHGKRRIISKRYARFMTTSDDAAENSFHRESTA